MATKIGTCASCGKGDCITRQHETKGIWGKRVAWICAACVRHDPDTHVAPASVIGTDGNSVKPKALTLEEIDKFVYDESNTYQC